MERLDIIVSEHLAQEEREICIVQECNVIGMRSSPVTQKRKTGSRVLVSANVGPCQRRNKFQGPCRRRWYSREQILSAPHNLRKVT